MGERRILYSETRPYFAVDSLDELAGPTTGVVELPHHLDWSEQGVYDLDRPDELGLMYEVVLREAMGPEDLHRYLDAALLRRVWHRLYLPQRVRALWEGRFPELARTAA